MALWHRMRMLSFTPKAMVVAGFLVGILMASAAGALAARSAGDRLASVALDKLGEPEDVLESIADHVVDRLAGKSGPLSDTQKALVDRLSRMAGKKLSGIDAEALLRDMKDEFVDAGLGKLDGIDTDKIIEAGLGKVDGIDADAVLEQVKQALIASATEKIENLDLEKLAQSVLKDVATDVDIEKMFRKWLDEIDVEALIAQAADDMYEQFKTDNPYPQPGPLASLLLGL